MRPLTLRSRLAAGSAAVIGLLVMLFGVTSYRAFAEQFEADAADRLTLLARGLHGYLRVDDQAATVSFDHDNRDASAFVSEATRLFRVYDVRSGRVLAESPLMASHVPRLTPQQVDVSVAEPRLTAVPSGLGDLTLASSLGHGSDAGTYLVQVGRPRELGRVPLARYVDFLFWGLRVAVVGGIVSSLWISAFALLPLTRVTTAVREIRLATLRQRLPTRGTGDELDQVVEAFNDTLARLDRAVDEMRVLSSAMAHELRTPLAALRGDLELASRASELAPETRDDLFSALDDVDRLTRLIDQILTLARAEAGQIRMNYRPFDLRELAAALVGQLGSVAEVGKLTLTLAAPAAVPIVGDPWWIERMLMNLISNAIKFTPAGGSIVIRIVPVHEHVRIEVRDSGIGLSPADAARVFERFFRADPARSSGLPGAGLGLSLVQWIAEQHKGSITVDSRQGDGSTFAVTLPRHPVPPASPDR